MMPESERSRLSRDDIAELTVDWVQDDAPPCGLWWILSTVTTFVFVGITVGIFLWLVLA